MNQRRILLRRARLALDGQQRFVHGRLEIDANTLRGAELRPFEAFVGIRWPERESYPRSEAHPAPTLSDDDVTAPLGVDATMGLRPVPFGFDASEPALKRPYLEQTTVSQAFFATARDLGIGVGLRYRFIRLSTALMNGQPLGTDDYQALDPTSHKDWLGRVGVVTGPANRVFFVAGFSWLAGQGLYPGSAAAKDTLVWTDGNENGQVELSELSAIPGSPARPAKSFSRFALGGDARLVVALPWLGRLVVRGEVAKAENLDRAVEPADPVAAGRDIRELGWSAGVSQEITRWLEASARYDFYDPDADERRQEGVSVVRADLSRSTASFALALRGDGGRLMVSYDRRDNNLGLNDSGRPTRLANDSLAVRAEARWQ